MMAGMELARLVHLLGLLELVVLLGCSQILTEPDQ